MYFVFDIESIPDIPLLRSVMEDPPEEEEALLEKASETFGRGASLFLPPIFHQIVSWVGLWITSRMEPKEMASWTGNEEAEGVKKLADTLSQFKDFKVVHHNGKGFDLPLITYRAVKHGIVLPGRLFHHDIRYRFSRDNVDLMDEFSNYGASNYPGLKHLGALIGIPVKQTGMGSDVLEMYRKKEFSKIENYCHEDVMGTYLVWLHLKFTSGELKKDIFESLRTRALEKLHKIQHLSENT